jgi:GNAT superfamily N-acetyltransferase
MTPFTIRPFTPADYVDIAAIHNALFPDFPETAHELETADRLVTPGTVWGRYVAEANGQMIGVAKFLQVSLNESGKFYVGVIAAPLWQGQGVGKRLYRALMEAIAPHQPTLLRVKTGDQQTRALRFLADRGYVQTMHEHESRLDMVRFDPQQFAPDRARATTQNVQIASHQELKTLVPDFDKQVYELHWEIMQDVPNLHPPAKRPYSEWKKRYDRLGFLPDGHFYAVHDNRLIGMSVLWGSESTPNLYTGTTGTLRAWRKRGMATALKVAALSWAKEQGAPFVYTTNEIGNTGMLGINARLGFVRHAGWVHLVKEWTGTA